MMVKTIPLTLGKVALVDDEDYDELNKFKWYAHKDHNWERWYVVRHEYVNRKQKTILMHQQITGFKHKMIDHVDRDGLNNKKSNLRPCTQSQNAKNRSMLKNNTSGLRGVHYDKKRKKWIAQIEKDEKGIYLGGFIDKEDAGRAVDKKSKELYGEFVILNFPEEKK